MDYGLWITESMETLNKLINETGIRIKWRKSIPSSSSSLIMIIISWNFVFLLGQRLVWMDGEKHGNNQGRN